MKLQRTHLLRLVVLVLVFVANAGILRAAPNLADYPLRVRIFQNHWGGSNWNGYHGFGRANLIDGPDVHAMEYTFDCDDHFMASDGGEAYPARWKKIGQEVEMLVGIIGTDKVHRCTMKVTTKDFVFVRENGNLNTISVADYQARQANRAARQQALAPTDVDNTHYPLKLTILNLNWGGALGGIVSGMGQGNLLDADHPQAVDFTLNCPVRININPEGRYYRGQWKTEGSTMTLLLHKMGEPGAAATCDVKTTVHADVYVRRGEGDLKAVSVEQYKAIQHAENAPAGDSAAQN